MLAISQQPCVSLRRGTASARSTNTWLRTLMVCMVIVWTLWTTLSVNQNFISPSSAPQQKAVREPSSALDVAAANQAATRRQILSGAGMATLLPPSAALAFETYKDTISGFEFKYPTGLQKSSSKLYNYFVRDLVEPLESVGVRVQDTTRKSLDEVGDVNAVAQKLLDDTVPKGAPREVIKATSNKDKLGRRYDVIEYAYQWKFDPDTAARLGRRRFQLHSKALVIIDRKRQYLVLAAAEEPRWQINGDQLSSAIETFELIFD